MYKRQSFVLALVPDAVPFLEKLDGAARRRVVLYLGAFSADALLEIADEARRDPETVRSAPHTAPVRRLDEATAARQPDLRWRPMTGAQTPCPD